jgi:opacity protein-like surface antigen
MRKPRVSRLTTSALVALVTALAVAPPAQAQVAGNGFLFHKPNARVAIRGGYALASAGSDLFEFTTQQLTLDKRDFSGLSFGASIGIPATDRLDVTFDAGYSRSSKGSEFRDFVDNDDLPIEQRTTFERVPLTLNLKYYLSPPGTTIGTAAWIPSKITPWVGVGGGLMKYRFHQEGDWVDFNTNNVFPSTFESAEWTPVVQGMAGADFSLTPLIALTTEARYLRAKGTLERDFGGFDKIDLSGVSASVGLSFRL